MQTLSLTITFYSINKSNTSIDICKSLNNNFKVFSGRIYFVIFFNVVKNHFNLLMICNTKNTDRIIAILS